MQSNPHLDTIRGIVAQDRASSTGTPSATAPAPHAQAEAITAPPVAAAPLAQPAGPSLTEVGAPPPTPTTTTGAPVEPLPGQSPPINASMVTPSPGPTARGAAIQAAGAASPVNALLGQTPAATVPQTGASASIVATPEVTGPPPAQGRPSGPPPQAILGQAAPPSAVERQTPKAGPAGPAAAGRPPGGRGDVFRSPETQTRLTKKASAQGDVEGEIAGLVSGGFTEEEARALVKAKMERQSRGAGGTGYQSIAGQAPDADGVMQPVNGAFDRASGKYIGTDPDSDYYGIPIPGFISRAQGGLRTAGMDREAIALADYGMRYEELAKTNPQAAQAVLAKERDLIQGKAKARGAGAGQAAYEKPIGVSEAQRTNTAVGKSSAAYAGQEVPSNAEQDTRRGIESVKTELDHVQTLLGALPKQGELAGLAPGATLAIRRRSPQYRTQVAQLESALDNIVNVLARTVGQQRGAQTEQDATRAYNTVVSMKARLLDPLAGDTQESAAARIAETMRYLDTVLSKLPAAPVAGVGPGVSPGVGQPPPAPVVAAGGPPPGPAGASVITAKATPAAKVGLTPTASKTAGPAGLRMVNGVLTKADGTPY